MLYTREGCCLCDQAREVLLSVRRRWPFEFEERDIEAEERLLRRYLERIPVVELDGREVLELQVEEEEFERLIAAVPGDDPVSRVHRG